MKKLFSILICFMMVISLALPSFAISTVQIKGIKLEQNNKTLNVRKIYYLKTTLLPENTTQKILKFSTSNSSIAKVDAVGKVTAVKPGKVVITISSAINNKISAKCNISVVDDPSLKKFSPEIKITVGRSISDGNKFADGEDFNNNTWLNYMIKHTGVKSNVVWAVPAITYNQKVNIVIASGDIPDLMQVNGSQLQSLSQAGMIKEMGPVINKWQSAKLKSIIAGDPSALPSATFDGKVMGVPIPGTPAMGYNLLYYRADWFKKLGLKVPKTMDEFMTAAKAFAKNNPDGAKKTYGFAINKDFFGAVPNSNSGFAGLEGYFSGYHVAPNIWVKDASGNAVWGGIQPNVKPILAKLQQMYKDGLIDNEFAVKDSTKVSEDIANGMIGMQFGQWWNPYWPLNTSVDKNPNADWQVTFLPSVDAKPALSMGVFSTEGYWVIRKGYKYPEALVRVMNFILDYNNVDIESYDWNAYADEKLVSSQATWWNHGTLWIAPPTKNADVCTDSYLPAWKKRVEGKSLTLTEKSYVDTLSVWYDKKDTTLWNAWACFGPNGTLDLIGSKVLKNPDNYMIQTLYNTVPTQIMIDKWPALHTLQVQTYTKIIMGESLGNFDNFVEQWKKAGGEDITKEVNKWYQSHK